MEAVFQTLKTCLSESLCLSFYDETKPIIVYYGAILEEVSSILLQQSPDKEGSVAMRYLSRSLTQIKMRYSQIERNCFAAVHACERNRVFLYGQSFTLINDNKPLTLFRTDLFRAAHSH